MIIKRMKNTGVVSSKEKASTVNKKDPIAKLADEMFKFLRDKGATAYEARWAWRYVNNRLENLTSHSEIATLVEANKKEE